MPKFFISFISGGEVSEDYEGQDFPGMEEARAAALISARELLADSIKADSKIPLEADIISNDRGQELTRIPAKIIMSEQMKKGRISRRTLPRPEQIGTGS
jgi:hypothetical protein